MLSARHGNAGAAKQFLALVLHKVHTGLSKCSIDVNGTCWGVSMVSTVNCAACGRRAHMLAWSRSRNPANVERGAHGGAPRFYVCVILRQAQDDTIRLE